MLWGKLLSGLRVSSVLTSFLLWPVFLACLMPVGYWENILTMAGYFLIVAYFINCAKQNGVPVGPGRGSGAGSLVAYSLGITDLDPLRYDLLFERFLNP